MTSKKNGIKYAPDISKVEDKNATSYDFLLGITTTIYNDVLTKHDREGRAKILKIKEVKELNEPKFKSFVLIECEVTFIGDRGRLVNRTILARRIQQQQLSLL